MASWPVQDAETHFGELLETCLREGPQVVTKLGDDAAILVPIEEWRQLLDGAKVLGGPKPSLKDLLLDDEGRAELDIPPRDQGRWRDAPILE